MIVVASAIVIGLRGSGTPEPPPSPPPVAIAPVSLFVDPTGSNSNDGKSAATPLQTIQAALEKATPATTINLAAGTYHEQPVTVRDGLPGAPITIKGPESGLDRTGRYQAVLYGTGRVFTVDNSHYTLDGFTIDGQEGLRDTPFPTDIAAMDAFKIRERARIADGRLIYVGAADYARDLTGITISNMFLNGAGGECVRLRNNAHGNTIVDSVVQYCGMFGKGQEGEEDEDDRSEFHNGEGVYIGTSPKSEDQPMFEDDGSSDNTLSGNVIRTFGSECLNVKENAHDNVFDGNVCSDNTESTQFDGSNIELRGFANVVRNNVISNSAGFNVKIQSDEDDYDNGDNVVENNRMSGAAGAALKLGSDATQKQICGNAVTSPVLFDEDGEEPTDDITAPCPTGGSAPPAG